MSFFSNNSKVNQLSASLAEKVSQTDLNVRGLNVTAPLGTNLTPAKGDNTTDDTAAIQAIINYCASNNLKPFFPTKTYLITSTIVIPSGCKVIDFNFSTFNYKGATGTYCISGGATDNGLTNIYNYASWSNLTINIFNVNTAHGMNIKGIHSGYYKNILIYGSDHGIDMGYSFSSLFEFCTVNGANVGIVTGEASNAITFSALSITSCALGVRLGDSTGGSQCFNVTFDSSCEFQSNGTVFELHMIQQASIINAYFEANTLPFYVASNSNSNNGIYNFSVENCIFDVGNNVHANFLQVNDANRQLYMKFTNNRFTGSLTGTYFDKTSGLSNYGNWQTLVFKNNTYPNAVTFTNIFPTTFHIDRVECDLHYLPTIDTTKWTVYQTVKMYCHGNSEFEITGVISRVNGQTGSLLVSGTPYWFFSETLILQASILQSASGATGLFKTARVEFKNNQTINLYTQDTTDLNNIHLTGTRWKTNA